MIDRGGATATGRTPRERRLGLACAAGIIVCCHAGCVREIDTEYGVVRGDSINGVSAFVQLLRDSGRPTTARQRLPDTIDPDCRTIVIIDDSFTGLEPATATTLERLVDGEEERTILLVLRDSDAVVPYLRAVLAEGGAADVRDEARRRLAVREAELAVATAAARAATAPFPDGLATVPREPNAAPIEVRTRTARGTTVRIDAAWPLRRRLEPGPTSRVVWSAEREPLLVRRTRGGCTLLVLASAAPLLNGGLVDPGNRALAEELVALLPPEGRALVTRPRSPAAAGDGGGDGGGEEDDGASEPSPWRLLAVQPLPWVAIHALAAIGLFCWWRSPIFGRPRREDASRAQDFGHHVEALAGLFTGAAAAGDAYTAERLRQWTQEAPRTSARGRGRRRD